MKEMVRFFALFFKKNLKKGNNADRHHLYTEVAQGERGELWLKGPNIMKVSFGEKKRGEGRKAYMYKKKN